MRAFISFLVMLVVVGALGYGGLVYVRDNADKFKPDSIAGKLGHEMKPVGSIPAPARGPADYHILQGQGGEPKALAQQAGLATDKWAYLAALIPVQQSDGIEAAEGLAVRGLNYDLGFRFNPKSQQDAYLEYNLGAKWDELHFGFGFSDTEPSDPTNSHAIELSVLLDGKAVFGPQRISPVDKPVFTRLDVKGVNRVLFQVKRTGTGNTFSPLLLDPFVRLAQAAPEGTSAAPAPDAGV